MNELLAQLTGGDRRSIGQSNHVAASVLAKPHRVRELFDGLTDADPVVRARAADALEKVSARRPDLLQPFKAKLLEVAAEVAQIEVRWHVAQLLPRMALSPRERERAFGLFVGYLADESRIVRTFALQAIADLSQGDMKLRAVAKTLLRRAAASGSPAMKARARKLLSA